MTFKKGTLLVVLLALLHSGLSRFVLPGEGLEDQTQSTDDEDSDDDSQSNLLHSLGSRGEPLGKFKCYSNNELITERKLPEEICENAVQCWTYVVLQDNGSTAYRRGCSNAPDQARLLCSAQINNHRMLCCEGDFCNNNFTVIDIAPISAGPNSDEMDGYIWRLVLAILSPIVGLIVVGGIAGLIFLRRFHTKRLLDHRSSNYSAVPRDLMSSHEPLSESAYLGLTSGSGSGLPLLIQRTLAKQISLAECIGKGRYGEVWRGVWHGENVAVKIFFSRDEASWSRETEIYSTVLLRHENILGYVGSDMTSVNSCTQLWLVTHYHANGSLYDHLNRSPLPRRHAMTLAISLMAGLAHLHSEILGTQGKPAIAHRDIKSKNILIKSNGVCAIADFGLAVTHSQTTGQTQIAPNTRVGTKRYMAPELLDESIDMTCFEALKRVDMYAVGLVLWELARRIIRDGAIEDYQPPFFDRVGTDPSFDEMRKIVCVDNYRPVVPNTWTSDIVLSGLGKLMKECWHSNSNARLPALRVKKTLIKITSSLSNPPSFIT